jgi:preprotein translocase subunit SecF
MFIIKYKTLFIGLSVFLLVASVFSVLHFGIKKGIDFTGGTVVEIRFQEGKEINVDHKLLQGKGVKVYSAPGGYKFISQKSHEEVQQAIASAIDAKSHPYVETQVNNVGPSMGCTQTAVTRFIFASE